VERREQTREAIAAGHYVPFWLLLYHPLSEVREALPDTLNALDLEEEGSIDGLLQAIVAFTFRVGMPLWAEMAAEWLASGLPVDDEIARAVDHMVETEAASQRARHDAFRQVARWRKGYS
jgi:hypothetical protein